MKITVYFESRTHAEIAAIFADEDTYDACFPALEKIAKEARMIVTESVEEKEDIELYQYKSPSTVMDVKHKAIFGTPLELLSPTKQEDV